VQKIWASDTQRILIEEIWMAQIHNLGTGGPNGIRHDAWDIQILDRTDSEAREHVYVHIIRTAV
jgi:hypothetical protein